jgi:DNA-nicking Smr family endonuclease
MTKSRSLSDDERALWDTVTRAVAPLRKPKPKKSEEPAVSAAPSPPRRMRAVKAPPPAPPKAHAPPPLVPLGRRMRSKLVRGSESIDDRIDLHGMTQADAHAALAHFLRRAQHRGARVVLVITGKGVRNSADASSERGVLKRQVPHWLDSAALRPLVIGYESAGATHGGAGALYVRLRRG